MLRVYLDEDVDVLLARLLSVRGYDCTTALHEQHLGWTDVDHLEWSQGESRVLITHNRVDFESLARRFWSERRDHAGIVLAVRRVGTYELMRRVVSVLERYDQSGWRNVVMYA